MSKAIKWAGVAISVAVLLVAAVAFTQLPGTPTETNSEWDETATKILNGSEVGALATPVPRGQPRRAGVYAGLTIAALMVLLYAYRRRPYILDWAGVWVLLSFGLYIISRGYAQMEHAKLAAALLMLTKMGSVVLLFRSAHKFAGSTPYTTKSWLAVPLLFTWFVIGAGRFTATTTLAPVYVLTGLMYLRTAMIFGGTFRARRMLGILLLAAPLAANGLMNLGFGIFFPTVISSAQLLLVFLTWTALALIIAAFAMCFVVFEEVTHELRDSNRELREAQQELEKLATVDALTGCYNRHFFEQNLRHELQRRRRYGTPLSILFIDINSFKAINDSFGHDVGDRVLQYFGEFLRRRFREADYVVRWGGDEFLVLITCSGAEAAMKAEELKARLDDALDANTLPPGLSLSVGYAEVPQDSSDILPFIRSADQNMYADKRRYRI